MFKQVIQKDLKATKVLKIHKLDYERILMWAQSNREILFLCLGNKNMVKKVVRLCNISRKPQNTAMWSENQRKSLIKTYKKSSFSIVAEGHSHPCKHHDRHPSRLDVECGEMGAVELIAFPYERVVRAWVIGSSVSHTKNQEMKIQLLD